MSRKQFVILLVICVMALTLMGCQAVARAQQMEPTPPVKVPSVSAESAIKPSTSSVSTNVVTLSSAGQELNENNKVDTLSISNLAGTWVADHGRLIIKVPAQTDQTYGDGIALLQGLITSMTTASCNITEWFTITNTMLTWGSTDIPCNATSDRTGGYDQAWVNNPGANYEISITRLDDGSDQLMFVLNGEDPIGTRQEFLDGKTFTRVPSARP